MNRDKLAYILRLVLVGVSAGLEAVAKEVEAPTPVEPQRRRRKPVES